MDTNGIRNGGAVMAPNAKKQPPRLVGIAEAAGHAGISPRTLRRYIADGLIPGYRVGPRLVKIDLADLGALVKPIPTTLQEWA
jgi:excisionase family DNA binding protein